MQRQFGLPYLSLYPLYAVEEIDAAYQQLADRFGFSWDDHFAAERRQALTLQGQARQRLSGLRFILAPRIDLPLPLALYLSRLGMEPLLLHLEEYYPEDGAYAQELTGLGHNPWICRMVNAQAEAPLLSALAADLAFGYLPDAGEALACVPELFDFYGQIGYSRSSSLLNRIAGVLAQINTAKGGNSDGTAPL